MIKKHNFTLLEVLITISLLALLSALLFSNYFLSVSLAANSKKIKQVTAQQAWAYQRLLSTLGRTSVDDKSVNIEEHSLFYMDNKVLLFTYDNEIDKEPKFSGRVLGKLYQEDERLFLDTISLKDASYLRKETIIEGINKCSFKFYNPPQELFDFEEPFIDENKPPFGDIDNWKKEFLQLPQSIKVMVYQKDNSSALIFPILISEPILYLKE